MKPRSKDDWIVILDAIEAFLAFARKSSAEEIQRGVAALRTASGVTADELAALTFAIRHIEAEAITRRAAPPGAGIPKGEASGQVQQNAFMAKVNDDMAALLRALAARMERR